MAIRFVHATHALLAFPILSPWASADETTRVSSAPSGNAGSLNSFRETISADGNVIAFVSLADDLVANDANGLQDVFVFDRSAGTLTRVSISSSGVEADGYSESPALSADGRYVSFESAALNLDGLTNPNGTNIYVHDRAHGTTTLISRGPSGTTADYPCRYPSISADGQRVAFDSSSPNLVANDANGLAVDVFVWDAASGTVALASANAGGLQGDSDSREPSLSADGTCVAFESSATNFPDSPEAGDDAVYVKNLVSGVLERVDFDNDGKSAKTIYAVNGISDDGNLVLFSTGDALVPEDTNGALDAYIRDRAAGTLERASAATGGIQFEGSAFGPCMSADGRFVAFHTSSPLIGDDTNDRFDVYLRDRAHDVTARVSVGTFDEQGSDDSDLSPFLSHGTKISADGSAIVFETEALEFALHDENRTWDVFLRVRDLVPAGFTHYGVGFPGRAGVIPTMTPRSTPYRGATITVDVTNSAGIPTLAFVVLGGARADEPTALGGRILVDPILIMSLPLDAGGSAFSGEVPTDWWASGLVLEIQALELDPWAFRGVSFSSGLEMTFGDG